MRMILLALLLLPHLAFAAASNVFSSPRDEVRLVSARNTAPAGEVRLALEFSLRPGWHIYWQNPGDAGFPPQLLPAAPVSFGPLEFPPPEFLATGPVGAYVLSGHVLLPFAAHDVGSSVRRGPAGWSVLIYVCRNMRSFGWR